MREKDNRNLIGKECRFFTTEDKELIKYNDQKCLVIDKIIRTYQIKMEDDTIQQAFKNELEEL